MPRPDRRRPPERAFDALTIPVMVRTSRERLESFDRAAAVAGYSRSQAMRDAMMWWTARQAVHVHRARIAEARQRARDAEVEALAQLRREHAQVLDALKSGAVTDART